MDSSKSKIGQSKNKAKAFWSFLLSKAGRAKSNGTTNTAAAHVKNGQAQIELDKKLVFSLAKTRIPNWRQFRYISKFLTARERWFLRICFLVIFVSLVMGGTKFYYTHLETVPLQSGQYIEGLVGAPRYLNPLYATVSDIDHDISQLMYSSLFIRDKNGALANDLVESYTTSDDHKTYTIKIKPDARWHDGSLLTADDVIFTFNAIKDKEYKSPLRISFNGVNIEKIDSQGVKFVLADPYAAFLDLLTFGIMPAELWQQIPPDSTSLAELNLKPVGSGPFKFDKLAKDKAGNIKEYYIKANNEYYRKPPHILNIGFKFYPGFAEAIAALNDKQVDGLSYLPQELNKDVVTPKALNLYKLHLPQINAIFFNQKKNSALADKAVRQALYKAIDRDGIIGPILNGDAYIVDGPILPQSFAYNQDAVKRGYNQAEAASELESAGWMLADVTADMIAEAMEALPQGSGDETATTTTTSQANENTEKQEILRLGAGQWRKKGGQYLVITLTTVDRTENALVAAAIKDYWEKIGVKTEVELVNAGKFQADIIKPRNFTALFYGLIVGSDPDPYAFWHSTQAGDGGLNLADYSNKEVDQLLEEARLTSDQAARQAKYKRFQEVIAEDVPALFLYSPAYTYVQSKDVKGFMVNNLYYPSDRFANITEWYVKTGKRLVW